MRKVIFELDTAHNMYYFNPNYYASSAPFTMGPEEKILILLDTEDNVYRLHHCCGRLALNMHSDLGYIIQNNGDKDLHVQSQTTLTEVLECSLIKATLVSIDIEDAKDPTLLTHVIVDDDNDDDDDDDLVHPPPPSV